MIKDCENICLIRIRQQGVIKINTGKYETRVERMKNRHVKTKTQPLKNSDGIVSSQRNPKENKQWCQRTVPRIQQKDKK